MNARKVALPCIPSHLTADFTCPRGIHSTPAADLHNADVSKTFQVDTFEYNDAFLSELPKSSSACCFPHLKTLKILRGLQIKLSRRVTAARNNLEKYALLVG